MSAEQPVWEDVQLEASNQLSVWLSIHAQSEFDKWNDIVDPYKTTVIEPLVDPRIRAVCSKLGLKNSIVANVCWDVIGALMENAYLYTGHKTFFFLELLELYEEGHFPCGWEGEWPNGILLYY